MFRLLDVSRAQHGQLLSAEPWITVLDPDPYQVLGSSCRTVVCAYAVIPEFEKVLVYGKPLEDVSVAVTILE